MGPIDEIEKYLLYLFVAKLYGKDQRAQYIINFSEKIKINAKPYLQFGFSIKINPNVIKSMYYAGESNRKYMYMNKFFPI